MRANARLSIWSVSSVTATSYWLVETERRLRQSCSMATRPALPSTSLKLSYAGLLPQAFAVIVIASGSIEYRFSALALAFAYAALIFSFLGGLWWGLAAADPEDAPAWIWIAGITPSLIALAACIPWAVGAAWPAPSLIILGLALLATPLVDRTLDRLELAPAGWRTLRRNLSLGLGFLTIAAALF